MLAAVLAAAATLGAALTSEPAPDDLVCWNRPSTQHWDTTVSGGGAATHVLGVGHGLEVLCLGGWVTSTLGAPQWEGTLTATDAKGRTRSWPATALYNASLPYTPRIYNADEANTTWSIAITSYNWIWPITVNIHYEVKLAQTPLPETPPPQPLGYNDAAARVAAIYASIAYNPPETIKAWNLNASCLEETVGATNQKIYTTAGHGIYTPFAYTAVDHHRHWIVVGFKGTNDTYDMIQDIINVFSGGLYYHKRCVLNEYAAGRAHSGMCQTYQNLRGSTAFFQDVMNRMADFPYYNVLVTGHSLGGALAVLFATDLMSTLRATRPEWVPRVGGFTFGAPRVGDYAMAGAVIAPFFRVVHADDAVPHLCPCCAAPDGRHCVKAETCPYHVDEEIWYPQGMAVDAPQKRCGGVGREGEDPACSNGVPKPISIEAHLHYFNLRIGSQCYPPAEYEKVRVDYEADQARYRARGLP